MSLKGHWSKKTHNIITYRTTNPCLTMQDVATKFGVSREYVRRVCKLAGIATASVLWVRDPKCPTCGERKGSRAEYCRKCHHEQHTVTLACDLCGNHFRHNQSYVLYKIKRGQVHWFCSNVHKGVYAGTHFGFGAQSRERIK